MQIDQHGDKIGTVSAAELRAELVREARRHEALSGKEDEATIEAEAGAILEAETAGDIAAIRDMLERWIEAHSK